jgi:hypothetical protein
VTEYTVERVDDHLTCRVVRRREQG